MDLVEICQRERLKSVRIAKIIHDSQLEPADGKYSYFCSLQFPRKYSHQLSTNIKLRSGEQIIMALDNFI